MSDDVAFLPAEVIGYRVWRLGGAGALLPQVSVHPDGATIWRPGDVTAACRHGHVAPAPGCSCGLHAVLAHEHGDEIPRALRGLAPAASSPG